MSKTSNYKRQPNDRPAILMIVGGLGAGGKEQQLLSLLKGLKERSKYSVILVAINPNGSREDEARQYIDHLINIKRSWPFAFFQPLLQVVKIARKFNVSVIHTWGSGIWDLLGLCASRWLRISFLHGGIRSAPASLTFNNRVSQWCANRADAVVANSQAGLNAFGQADKARARVIYNGLDFSRFEGIQPEKIQYDLCMVANFSNHKDHQTVVNAMPTISTEFPQTKLLLVGRDAGTLEQTKTEVNQLGLDSSVIFVTDCLKPYQFIANSRLCVLATYGEGISNSILEYFAFAKPVVASDVAGNSEIIVSGKNGFLVENKSAEALAEKIILLLKNPDLAEQLGNCGKEIVINKFGVETMINSYESVYSDLIVELEDKK